VKSIDKFGWVAGFVAEAMLGGTNWIGRIEYLHYGFGAIEDTSMVSTPGFSYADTRAGHSVDVVRAGLSYRFADHVALAGSAAPAIAADWTGFYVGGHAAGAATSTRRRSCSRRRS
jgi:outer membrane immunogenic protein